MDGRILVGAESPTKAKETEKKCLFPTDAIKFPKEFVVVNNSKGLKDEL